MAIEANIKLFRMMKAAKTLAALNGRRDVLQEDVQTAADMALQHRMRRKPFQQHGVEEEKIAGIISHAHAHKHEHIHPHTHENIKR